MNVGSETIERFGVLCSMAQKLLTVVITAYNQEEYIEECIRTVASQTYKDLDIVIVDDGSIDGTGSISDKWAEGDTRIRVIHKINGGSVSARKCGISEARGEYIAYIDGDDWLEPDHYEKVMNCIDDADIYAFSLTCVYDNNEREIISNYAQNGLYTGEQLDELKNIALYPGVLGQFGLFPSMCAKVFRTDLIRNNMLAVNDNIRMGDDGACTYPSVCDARKIIVNNEIAGYMYRKNISGTLTSSYSFIEFERIENLYHVLSDAFMTREAEFMMEQMTYYLAFLFRLEMVNELANPYIGNICVKVKHLKQIHSYDWVQYLEKNADTSKLDGEGKILLENINSCWKTFYNWYVKRKLFNNINRI